MIDLSAGAYAFFGEASLWYLGVTIVSAIGSAVILSLKASLHKNFNRVLPLLFFSSAVFALAHIVVAYKARYQARRKLGLDGVSIPVSLSLSFVEFVIVFTTLPYRVPVCKFPFVSNH